MGVNRWGYVGLVILVVSGSYFIYQHRQSLMLSKVSQPATANQPRAATGPAEIVWQKVDRTGDGFQIEMQANAKQIKIPAYNERGVSEQADM